MAMRTKIQNFFQQAPFWQAASVNFLLSFISSMLSHFLRLQIFPKTLPSRSWAEFTEDSLWGALLFGLFFTLFIRKSRSRSAPHDAQPGRDTHANISSSSPSERSSTN
jgi:hypothetical protein